MCANIMDERFFKVEMQTECYNKLNFINAIKLLDQAM